MLNDIKSVASHFSEVLNKVASRDKVTKKKLYKDLDKAKSEHNKLKSIVDDLESKKNDAQSKLDKIKSEYTAARKNMIKLHKTIQSMDISNASDVIFYNDALSDVGYVIDNKEYNLEINDDGEVELVPMHQYRKSKRQKQLEEEQAKEAQVEDELNLLFEDMTS